MLVVVVTMLSMSVAVVKIVHVVAVLHRFVGAVACAVRVLGEGVFCLVVFGHDVSSGVGGQLAWLPECGSRVWAMVSRMTWATWSSAVINT
jgi:hypothetical protein